LIRFVRKKAKKSSEKDHKEIKIRDTDILIDYIEEIKKKDKLLQKHV
jgi:hypothetical protein